MISLKKCKYCQEDILNKNPIFCSKKCGKKYHALGIRRHERSKILCIFCKNKKAAIKYCSTKCSGLHDQAIAIAKIEKDNVVPNPQAGRKYFLDKYGNICFICKGTIWMDRPIPLVLDHIDGNSENWNLKNLRMICCNCDAQTPTFKAKNKGNGRYLRRLRYKQGKSF